MDKTRVFVWRPLTVAVLIVSITLVMMSIVALIAVTRFKPTTEVRIGNGAYSLWVANTEEQRIQGLSGVERLHSNGGLLMDFGYDGIHGIWMKDMNFPLDIIWLDKHQKVIHIVMNAPIENPAKTVYQPKDNARYVIELPAGSVKKDSIKTDSFATFTIDV